MKSLFTSRPASSWGLTRAALGAPPMDVKTMAAVLREGGYATGGFTANSLVSGPGFEQGFEEYQVFEAQPALERSFVLRRLVSGGDWWRLFGLARQLDLCKAPGSAVWRATTRWLATKQRPFFAYVHLFEPHFPYTSHDFGLASSRPATPPLTDVEFLKLPPGHPSNRRLRGTPQLADIVARYDEEVRAADDILRGAVADLREMGLWDSTLFVFLADHGEEFCEHDGFMHGHDVFPEQARVPLLFVWPKADARAEITGNVHSHTSLLDVFPTLVEYLGLRTTGLAGGLGESVLASIRRPNHSRSVAIEAFPRAGSCVAGLVCGSKLARLAYTRDESPKETVSAAIFHIAANGDPLRGEPSLDESTLLGHARDMHQQRWLRATGIDSLPTNAERRHESPTDEALERLRAMGYVQ